MVDGLNRISARFCTFRFFNSSDYHTFNHHIIIRKMTFKKRIYVHSRQKKESLQDLLGETQLNLAGRNFYSIRQKFFRQFDTRSLVSERI
jgi:hypothetical protein